MKRFRVLAAFQSMALHLPLFFLKNWPEMDRFEFRAENLSPAMGRGIDSRNQVWNWVAKLHRLSGRYDNPMPTWFLAPIAGLIYRNRKATMPSVALLAYHLNLHSTSGPTKFLPARYHTFNGSMTFWCGSGSADPCLWLMYPDPDSDQDPALFRHWPSRRQQKTNLKK